MNQRIKAIRLFCLTIALLLSGRATYIQIIQDSRLHDLSKKQFRSKVFVAPRRGQILDRNGEPLAITSEIPSLAGNPSKIQNKKTLSRLLAKSLNLSQAKVYEKLKEKKEFIWIKRHLSESMVEDLKKWGIQDSHGVFQSGLFLVQENKRKYPHGSLASPILGSVDIDSNGTEGVEIWQNTTLSGQSASVSTVRDALGRPTQFDPTKMDDARDGESVKLTLDASLQFSVEQELLASIEKTKAKNGLVIVMNAVDGDILALAQSPVHEQKRNRAIVDGYEPGSTLKPILLASALTHGFKITDRIHGEHGSIVIQGRRISESESHEKFESITLKKAIQVSSNVVSAKLALKLGSEKYMQTLRSFGFGEKTGVGFPGELSGWLPNSKKQWQPLTLANIGFGQGIMVTPIQMIRSYAAFLNGGWLVRPRLVIENELNSQPEKPKRILSTAVAEQVLSTLESVTEKEGTGENARLEGYRVMGKTGTAQVVDPKTKRYSSQRYISTFIGASLQTEPKLVIMTYLDEPKGVYYSAETAAPLFKNVLAAVVNRFGMPSTQPQKSDPRLAQEPIRDNLTQTASHPEAPSKIQLLTTQTLVSKKSWVMPNLNKLSAREVLLALQGSELQLDMQGHGLVKQQHPKPGETVSATQKVKVVFSMDQE